MFNRNAGFRVCVWQKQLIMFGFCCNMAFDICHVEFMSFRVSYIRSIRILCRFYDREIAKNERERFLFCVIIGWKDFSSFSHQQL